MPVDASKNSNSRRSFRKLTSDEDIDIRRARGEISCAECRRLKLKCDKRLPCSSCVRRGCPSICPNGRLSTGQGTRFVLADTAQLHHKIAEMGQRIRQLEDALAIFQSSASNEPHPLLSEDLLAIKFGPEKAYPVEQQPTQGSSINPIDALGTLTIGDRGEAKYFGRSAGSETLFLAGAEMEMAGSEDDEVPAVSSEIARLSNLFPFGTEGTWNTEKALDMLFTFLPPQPRAWTLCETYLEQATWAFRPIRREELIDDILAPIYKSLKERKDPGWTSAHSVSPHKLAVIFMIFALGALVDLTLSPYNLEAENYFYLSRASLTLRSIFDSPEIGTVQAVLLMAAYHGMGGRGYTMDSAWALMSLGAKLAQSIGLHRDGARWNMDPKTVQRRRSLFWELFSAELFHCLALGRPPSIRLSYIDCEFPEDDEGLLDKNGQPQLGFYRWKHEFTKEVFSTVTELTLTAEAPSYQTVLDLDRKVREKPLPAHLNIFTSPEDEYCTPSVYMRRCLLSQFRSVTLLYIHRSFFAQAMLDHPVNPLRSPYAPSFLAAYRCASGVIKSNINYFGRFPDLCMRWWSIWTHLFSAAVIVGSIVTRAPSSSMAPSAFIELGLACDLFEKGAIYSRRARSGLAILCKLRNKAFQVYSQFRSGNPTPSVDFSNGLPDSGEDELAIFGGQTRVLVSKILSRRGVNRQHSNASPISVASPSSTSSSDSELKGPPTFVEAIPDVHPSLVEYLSLFPPSQYSSNTASPSPAFSGQPLTHDHSPPLRDPYQQPSHFATQHRIPSLPSWLPSPMTTTTSSSAPSGPIPNDPSTMSSSSIPDSMSFSPSEYPIFTDNTDSPPEGHFMDLGMTMSGESGMDEQWISFMRDSGILDGRP